MNSFLHSMSRIVKPFNLLALGGGMLACTDSAVLSLSDARLIRADNGAPTIVSFDLDWPRSFRDTANWDAAWVFAKFQLPDGEWRHATLSTDPTQHTVETNNGVTPEIDPAFDGRGVFLYPANRGSGRVQWDDVRLRWEHDRDGVQAGMKVRVMAFAIEMTHIPEGAFHLGDGDIGNVAGNFQSRDGGSPFLIDGEGPIQLGGTDATALSNAGGYGMRPGAADDFGDSVPAMLPEAFPKGYRSFYVMKRELTQGEYAAFLNSLTPEQQRRRNPALADESPAQPGRNRYTITTVAPFFAYVPQRAANELSWADAAAFADWAALRPWTEFEFEKASRGPVYPEPGEFPWGSTNIWTSRYMLHSPESPEERVDNPGRESGNASYVETMGSTRCPSCIVGPLNTGAFAIPDADREERGASYYGVLELGGNLAERTVTVGNSSGRRFDGSHGDGHLNAPGRAAGLEVATWPGSTATGALSQVTGAVGTGFRGGSWASPSGELHTSSRILAATADNKRSPTFGYRFARTSGSRDP
jgi:hypothetical protein